MPRYPLTCPWSRFVAVGLLAVALMAGTACAAHAQADPGDPAPDFTITNVLGTPATATLSDHRGSVVVIAFFAYW